MSLFKEALPTQAKLKMGLYGSTGTGKSFTASKVAAGIHKLVGSKKPVYFYDTENGSDFVNEKIFKPAGVKLLQLKSRSFPDLMEAVREAEKGGEVLIIDSITHVWDDFMSGYLKDTRQKFIELWDWKPLKAKWGEFTDLFVNSNVHIILCGRAGAIYEQNEEIKGGQRKNSAVKVGTKMRGESEMGYEPSLLVEMEKVYGDGDGTYKRVAHVVKDRFDAIDSKDFENPKFEDFLPHIKLLNLTGSQLGIDTSRKSEGIFDMQGNDDRARRAQRRTVLCEEIAGMLVHYFPGQSAAEKKVKADIFYKVLGTRSWAAVESDWQAIPLEKLEELWKCPAPKEPNAWEKACIEMRDAAGVGA